MGAGGCRIGIWDGTTSGEGDGGGGGIDGSRIVLAAVSEGGAIEILIPDEEEIVNPIGGNFLVDGYRRTPGCRIAQEEGSPFGQGIDDKAIDTAVGIVSTQIGNIGGDARIGWGRRVIGFGKNIGIRRCEKDCPRSGVLGSFVIDAGVVKGGLGKFVGGTEG